MQKIDNTSDGLGATIATPPASRLIDDAEIAIRPFSKRLKCDDCRDGIYACRIRPCGLDFDFFTP